MRNPIQPTNEYIVIMVNILGQGDTYKIARRSAANDLFIVIADFGSSKYNAELFCEKMNDSLKREFVTGEGK